MPRIVGIDLGTTNSLIAYVDEQGQPVVIRDDEGRAMVPSIVSIGDNGEIIVGEAARARLITDSNRTVYSIKRFMGKGSEDVREDVELLHFNVASGSEQVVRIKIGDKEYTPPEISAFILRELKRMAERHFGEEITQAVITVPAYFNDAQRQATRDAGRIAGLEVQRIVNEPTAASLAYGINKKEEALVAVYDFGGGTFDISILKLNQGLFEVLSTNGDTHLGGDDLDNVLIKLVLDEIHQITNLQVGGDSEAIQTIRKAVMAAKIDLSEKESTEINIELRALPERYRRTLTRTEFEERISHLVERTLEPCRKALKDASLTSSQIDEVVMVGGSTRVPLVLKRVEELFKRKPHTELNPDEVVALGAAVQADVLIGRRKDTLLLDVTPLSLGIETIGGVMSKIILRNSTIPASAKEMYTTSVDNQTGINIHILQGERELITDNRSLAHFTLKVPPQPAGLPRIEVKFLIDANGILSVSARDVRTGKEHSIEVKPSHGLTDEQVEQMLMDSFEYAEDDFKQRQLIEARTEAESVLASAEKAFASEAFQNLTDEEKMRDRAALNALKVSLSGGDHRVIRSELQKFNDATMHLAELMMDSAVQIALKGKKANEV